MKISRSETMSGKIRHLKIFVKIYRSETEVRISHTKKCDRQTHRGQRTDRGHSCLEKALLALKIILWDGG